MPVYLRDIAEVKDTTEDLRSFTRINGKPGVRLQVSKQSGKNTVAIADGVPRPRSSASTATCRSVHLTLLDDQSKFIERSIDAVKEAVYLGAFLVIAIIFIFLRNIRSTLIICTSIPISIVGTFALLYFAGFTLNTMTFGGLALGVGMIVDASIVVLENTFRHMEHGQVAHAGGDRGQRRSLVGDPGVDAHAHRRLRAAALPVRRLEHPLRAALDRRHVLADDVALRRRDGRAGALLAAAEAAAAASKSARGFARPPLHGERAHASRRSTTPIAR